MIYILVQMHRWTICNEWNSTFTPVKCRLLCPKRTLKLWYVSLICPIIATVQSWWWWQIKKKMFKKHCVWMCLISTFGFQLHFLFPGPDIMIILCKQLRHGLDKHNIKHIWLSYTAHFNSSNHPQHLLVFLTISLVSLSATIALHGEKSMRVCE